MSMENLNEKKELTNEELDTVVGGAPRFRYPGHYHPAGTIGDQKYKQTDCYDPCVGMIIDLAGESYICTELFIKTSGPVGHERSVVEGMKLVDYQNRNKPAFISCLTSDNVEYLVLGFES